MKIWEVEHGLSSPIVFFVSYFIKSYFNSPICIASMISDSQDNPPSRDVFVFCCNIGLVHTSCVFLGHRGTWEWISSVAYSVHTQAS